MFRSRYHTALVGTVLLLLAFAAAGCGDVDDAPDGSTITINPTSFTLTVAPASPCTSSIVQDFVAVLKKGGQPLNNLELRFTLTIPGFEFVDVNGNVIPRNVVGQAEIVRVTDENGAVRVFVAIDACKHFGDLVVTSGTANAKATITVVEGT